MVMLTMVERYLMMNWIKNRNKVCYEYKLTQDFSTWLMFLSDTIINVFILDLFFIHYDIIIAGQKGAKQKSKKPVSEID
jgi:hypothetical protein